MNLEELRRLLAEGAPPGRGNEDSVRRLWWAALATLQEDLLAGAGGGGAPSPQRGLWLASPLPALYEPALLQRLHGWVWMPAAVGSLLQPGAPLLPGGDGEPQAARAAAFTRLPLQAGDGTDPFLLLITPGLQVALALEGGAEERRLLVRFEAGVISAALELLDRRLQHDDPAAARDLHHTLRRLGPLHSDPAHALRFWPQLAQRLAAMAPSVTLQPLAPPRPAAGRGGERHGERDGEQNGEREGPTGEQAGRSGELALLEALTHEVRTPLATIRTLIRSLLRRSELTPLVRQRLEQIDGECSEQIDRFGLIFLAAELQRQPGRGQGASPLARTDLSRLLEQLEPLWRRQLQRRGLELELRLAAELPPVLSDPTRLETMLGGLVDRFTRSLPSGSQVRLSLRPAGSRLKLQLSSAEAGRQEGGGQQVGPVLSWNPGTGSLQLSRRATKQLFHSLGGRLTERGGGRLTVFFPVAER